MSSTHDTSKFIFIILMMIVFAPLQCLKMNSHEQKFQMNQFYIHQQTASMTINYTRQITSINKAQFTLAGDINNRIIKTKQQNLYNGQKLRVLGNASTTSGLNTQNISCTNSSQNIIQALLLRSTQMKQILATSLNTINFLKDQSQKQTIKQNIQNQLTYLSGVEQFFVSGCSLKINILPTFFVSNPNANNWLLGNWTYQEFISSYINTMNSNAIVTKCPIDKPFFTGKQCISCLYPASLWDMKASICTNCPYPQIVNLKTRTCIAEINYISNLADSSNAWISSLTSQQALANFDVLRKTPNAVICPFSTPFIIRQQCSYCPQKSVYVLEQQKCKEIPYNTSYDANIHKVVEKLTGYQTNKGKSSYISQGLQQCPASKPYFDQVTCVDCSWPRAFNIRTQKCQICINLDACGTNKSQIMYTTNKKATNLTGNSTQNVKAYIKSQSVILSSNGTLQCEIEKPYYSPEQRKCISCQAPNLLFNISTLKCTSCPKEGIYNQTTYTCVYVIPQVILPNKTNSLASNLLINNLTAYQNEQKLNKGLQCPVRTPYYSNGNCINCSLFNTATKQCQQCAKGYIYNSTIYQCVIIPIKPVIPVIPVTPITPVQPVIPVTPVTPTAYKTNSTFNNLWIKNLTQYQNSQRLNKNSQCVNATPYSTGSKCIQCQKNEIFNTTSLVCTTCPNQSVYNTTTFTCDIIIVKPVVSTNYISNLKYGVDPYSTSNKTLLLQKYKLAIKSGNQICPFPTPFSTGTSCIKCLSGQYFNLDTSKCQTCPSGSQFNEIIMQCQQQPSKYYTNLTSNNLLYAGQSQAYYQYKQNKSISNGSKQCTQNKPYYTYQNKCDICNGKQPYFNLLNRRCQNCDQGTTYDATQNQCLSPIGDVVTPKTTLEKSLANFFV